MSKFLSFNEISEILINSQKPSKYFEELLLSGKLDEEPFIKLKRLKDVPQSLKYHPEGNVWNHIMLVIDNGAYYKKYVNDKESFMWALLLHDIGKLKTTKLKKGIWTSYNHDKVGAIDGREFLISLKAKDYDFIDKVEKLIKYHMHFLYITKNLPFGNEIKMIEEVNLNDISLVFLCDRLGRGGLNKEDKNKIIESIEDFMKKYNLNVNLK